METQSTTSRIKSLLSGIGNAVKAGKQNVTNFLNKPIEVRNPVAQKAVQIVSRAAQATPQNIWNQGIQQQSQVFNAPVRVSAPVARVASRMATVTPIKLAQPTIKTVQDWKAKPSNVLVKKLGETKPAKEGKILLKKIGDSKIGQEGKRVLGNIWDRAVATSEQAALQNPWSQMGFDPESRALAQQDLESRGMIKPGTGGRTPTFKGIVNTGRTMLDINSLTDPSKYLSGTAFGTVLGTGGKIIENKLNGKAWNQDLGNAAISGGGSGFELAPTMIFTNSIVDKLSNTAKWLKPLTDERIKAGLPQGNMTLGQWTSRLTDTAIKRITKAVFVETPVETIVYGVTNKKDQENFQDSFTREFKSNLIMNVGFAGVNTVWDARTIAPIIKNSAIDTLKTMDTMKPGYARLDLGTGKDVLPNGLSKAKPRYNYGQKAFIPEFKSDVDKALYITAQTKKSASDDSYRAYLKNVIGMTDDEIALAGKEVRDFVKSQAKVLDGGDQKAPEIIQVPDMGIKTKQPSAGILPTPIKVEPLPQVETTPDITSTTKLGSQANELDLAITKTGNELGQVRADLAAETDPYLRDSLQLKQAQLESYYAELKHLQSGEGYVPAEPTPIAPNVKQASQAIVQPPLGVKTATTEGFTQSAEARLKAHQRVKVKQVVEEAKPGFFTRLRKNINNILSPMKNLDSKSEAAFRNHDSQLKFIENEARLKAEEFQKISNEDGIDAQLEYNLMKYSQKPTPENATRFGLSPEQISIGQRLINASQAFNDQVYALAKEAGIDINYLKNHLMQVYKESDAEINNRIKARSASGVPGFSKKKTIDDYQMAEDLGLTPAFTTFGQVNAEVYKSLMVAIETKKLVGELTTSGKLVSPVKAPHEWQPITSPGFPKSIIQVANGKSIEIPYKASPEYATAINRYFGGQERSGLSRALQMAAKASQIHQTMTLSSIGPANSFTISQIGKDLATSIGDIVMLRPRVAIQRLGTDVSATVRAFFPGLGKGFDAKHENSIKEMTSQGFAYGGYSDWRGDRKNIKEIDGLIKKAADGVVNGWNTLIENPTFKGMMWYRKVGQFEMYRDAYIRRGFDRPTAIKMAGNELNRYDGASDSLGRSQDFSNFLTAIFLATKYREGVFGSLTNIAKGWWNFKDPAYASSRALGIGMVATYLIYDKINQELNDGKHLSENPKGKQFSLVIPDTTFNPNGDPDHYIHIPWMPGFTATPRAIAGGSLALAKGDTKEAGKEFSKFGSTLLQTLGENSSGIDYFGREIFDPNKARLPQQVGHFLQSFTPGQVDELLKYHKDKEAGKNPSAKMAILRSFEIPIKEGKFSSQYFDVRDKVLKGADKKTLDAYAIIHPNKEAWETVSATDQNEGTPTEDRMAKALLRVKDNGYLYLIERDIAQGTGKTLDKEVDPIFTVPTETALRYWRYQSLPPADAYKKQLLKDHPEILDLMKSRTDYYQRNPIPNQILDTSRPIASPRVQSLMDAKNWQDPEVQAFLTANTSYQNAELAKLGLPSLSGGYGGYGGYRTKAKKVTIPKLPIRKTPLLEAPKKFTPIKLKSLLSSIKPPKIAPPAGTKLRAGSGYTPIKLKNPRTTRRMASTLSGIGRA